MPKLSDCREASVVIFQTNDGLWYERFILPDRYFDNQIDSPQHASTTPAPQVFYNRGECSIPQQKTESFALVSAPSMQVSASEPTIAQNVSSTLFLIAMVGGCVWLYLRGKNQPGGNADYHPMADLPQLPRLSELAGWGPDEDTPESNQTPGIRGEFDPEFEENSNEFEANSTSNSTIQTYEQFYGPWPPPEPAPLYDPQEPEQQSEFDDYRRIIQKHGLNPRGNEIITLLWGAKPGNSTKYRAAVKRREQFVKRLDYYRREGA